MAKLVNRTVGKTISKVKTSTPKKSSGLAKTANKIAKTANAKTYAKKTPIAKSMKKTQVKMK